MKVRVTVEMDVAPHVTLAQAANFVTNSISGSRGAYHPEDWPYGVDGIKAVGMARVQRRRPKS